MSNDLAADFNDTIESEDDIRDKGYMPLEANAIKQLIVGRTFLGSFPPVFKYIISINRNGSLEGKNNYQHYDTGKWKIDKESNTLCVSWDFGWQSSTSRVYQVDDVVKMFDATTGKLNTSFDELVELVEGDESIQGFKI